MIRFEEALERLLSGVRALGAERVPVDVCAGRVLADDVIAGFDMPAFDHTSMDGYAFASADFVAGDGTASAPATSTSGISRRTPAIQRARCRKFLTTKRTNRFS